MLFDRIRQRRGLVAVLSALVLATSMGILAVQAVHDAGVFELESNATDEAAPGIDWDAIFAAAPNCAGTDACSYTHENAGETIFTGGGSKDDLDTNKWKHKSGSVPDKDELADAFAARITAPNYDPDGPGPLTGPSSILYFGADRTANDGDAFMGFWFFQNNITALAGGTFGPGLHRDGDILIISDFSGGGDTVSLAVYQWNGPGGDVAGSGAINGTLDVLIPFGAADCGSVGANDPACMTVNDSPTASPWPFTDKVGSTQFRQGEFIEGGINLSFLGLDDECFSSFLAETRSSTSVNAVLKDFVGGQFAVCQASMTTDAQSNSIIIGSSNSDSATVTVSGSTSPPAPTGTVSFYLCGPTPGITSCDATGTPAGTANLANAVKNGNSYTVQSATVTPTVAGDYCFFATWPGDANYPGGASVTNFSDECFTVVELTPAITTAQFFYPNDIARVVVGPGAGALQGNVRFRVWTNNTCSGTPLYETTVDVTTGTGTGTDRTLETSNTTARVNASNPQVYWRVDYDSTKAGHVDVNGACGAENTILTINNG